MGGLSKTGVYAHDTQVAVLEGQRQSTMNSVTTQAGANTAEITYWRGRKASALANGGSPNVLTAEVANAQLELYALGTGGS